jgi:hypothetical protein
MKSLMLLWQLLLEELGSWCDTSTTEDRKTAFRRLEHERLSFLTITLPDFGKGFQKALDQGKVAHDLFPGFRFTSGLPQFLGGFLERVFDRKSGVLLDNPDIDCIFAIRQLTLSFAKIELPASDSRQRKAMLGYAECEKELKAKEREWNSADYADFSRVSQLLFGQLFSGIDNDIKNNAVIPKHGPGKTADRISNNARFRIQTWPWRLEKVFASVDFIVPNAKYATLIDDVRFLEPGAEIPVRVVSVPKTLKTPRIIAIEPTHMMYVQQAIYECFVKNWRGDRLLHQFLGFDDQVPNQDLARRGSRKSGNLATLDLSEASDRVSNQLVREMLRPFPSMQEGVDASRSRKADVLGHGEIRLSKFASMGSALCFPMEACVFLTCIFLGIEKELKTPLTYKTIKRFAGKVRVFGDDIIIPKEYVSSVVESLEHFGAKVNRAKSFWNGKFRESCGKEYYDGHDVSVVKIRQVLPTQRQHAEQVLATVSTRNQFYELGLWRTCAWLDEYLVRLLGRYPIVPDTSQLVGRISRSFDPTAKYDQTSQQWDRDLQKPKSRAYVSSAISPVDILDGEYALLKFFLKRGLDPHQEGHLERAGRPKAVNLKLRWVPLA